MMKGDLFLSPTTLTTLNTVLFPAYLVFIGIIMWYILALIYEETNASDETRSLLYTRMFIVGIAAWAVFALTYIFIV